MTTAFPLLALEAEKLAHEALLAPEARKRAHRTERVWRYRPYQQGDSAVMIDWKQSAKGNRLLIKQPEARPIREVYLWTPLPAQDEALSLLLALGQMLIKDERCVGWLGAGEGGTRTSSRLKTLIAHEIDLVPSCPAPPEASATHHAFLVLAGDLAAAPPLWVERAKSHAARGSKGLWLDFSNANGPLQESARTMGWPVVPARKDRRQTLLALFEESLLFSGQ